MFEVKGSKAKKGRRVQSGLEWSNKARKGSAS